MRLAIFARRQLVMISYSLALTVALAVAWIVRDQPLALDVLSDFTRVDALAAFFALLTLAGAIVITADDTNFVRTALATSVLLVCYTTPYLPIIGLGFFLATILVTGPALRGRRNLLSASIYLAAPACLLLAYSMLWLHSGVWRYDLPATAAALDSGVFWLVLLAAVLGGNPMLHT